MTLTGPIKAPVHTRGTPPDAFLAALIDWGRVAPEEIFAPRKDDPGEVDIYTHIRPILGPWTGPFHRRAAMLEVLRVLAGLESSWDWSCGRDVTNHSSVTPTTIEAGAWQVSANSRAFGQDLRDLAPADGTHFQAAMKSNHALAMEYISRLLRHTERHSGPVVRHEIDKWLSKDSVFQFINLIS